MGSHQEVMNLWQLLTRLGEAQILLPAASVTAFALWRRAEARPLVVWWLSLLSIAVLITTASKVAFIGWGIGSPELDFTGVSGHTMFGAAVYPLLLASLAANLPPWGRTIGLCAGIALALLIGVSRVVLGAHSVSEVVAGLFVGGLASAMVFGKLNIPAGLVGPAMPVVIALWLGFMPAHAPSSKTHSMVTRLALVLSGHKTPHTRIEMFRKQASRDHAGVFAVGDVRSGSVKRVGDAISEGAASGARIHQYLEAARVAA